MVKSIIPQFSLGLLTRIGISEKKNKTKQKLTNKNTHKYIPPLPLLIRYLSYSHNKYPKSPSLKVTVPNSSHIQYYTIHVIWVPTFNSSIRFGMDDISHLQSGMVHSGSPGLHSHFTLLLFLPSVEQIGKQALWPTTVNDTQQSIPFHKNKRSNLSHK